MFVTYLINYIKYTAGSTKGNTVQGDVFNDPFRLGKVDPQYTSSRVTKDYNLTESTDSFAMDWKPVVAGTVSVVVGTTTYVDDGEGNLISVPEGGSVARKTEMVQPVAQVSDMADLRLEGVVPVVKTIVYNADGTPKTTPDGSVDYAAGTITVTGGVQGAVQVAYSYNNVLIPQNDIPLLSAKIESMPLLAKARRIAIYYSQMAAFQAKTDYGMDLGDQLAEKAVGQLAYKI